MKIEIENVGIFEIKQNLLHRENSRIITFDKGKYKTIQFNSYRKDLLDHVWQLGYDEDINKIYIRFIN